MKTLATIAVILLTSSVTLAQWNKDGKPVADAPDRKSVGGFGGHLLVVKDPRAFIEEWQKPETPQIHPRDYGATRRAFRSLCTLRWLQTRSAGRV